MTIISKGTLRAIKYAARLMEERYPGSCKELIEAIDYVEKHPLFMLVRANAIASRWETIKEWYSKNNNLNEAEKRSLFDISDSSQWEEDYRNRWQKHQYFLKYKH